MARKARQVASYVGLIANIRQGTGPHPKKPDRRRLVPTVSVGM